MLVFRLQKRTVLLILILTAVVGALTFTAGMTVGVHWTLSNPALESMLAARAGTDPQSVAVQASEVNADSVPAAAPSPVPVSQRPVAQSPVTQRPVVQRPVVQRPVVQQPTAQLPTTQIATTLPAPSQPAIAASAAPPSVAVSTSSAVPLTALAQEVARPTAMESAVMTAAAAPAESRFAVQVGAFLHEENSNRMLGELQARGYEPYIVAKTGFDQRVLETVRLGHYPSRQQALLAAADFAEREGLDTAIVREPGAL